MEPVRIAVIGAGYWGKKVIREILETGAHSNLSKLHSVTDPSPSALAQCEKQFGGLDYRLDYRTLLSDPSLSAVHICTPNATHFEIASAFLRNGKHVLVEKPLALRAAEAYEMVRIARENDRVLCTGHIHRFNNGVKELKRVIDTGLLGEVYYLRLSWSGLLPIQNQRDVITDLAPHPFDISNFLLEAWPDRVTCRGRGYRTAQVEEVAFITAEHSHGPAAQIEVSWLDNERRRQVTVVGSQGSIVLDCNEQKAVLRRSEGVEQMPVTASNTLREEILHFARCVVGHAEARPVHNHSDGVLGARVVTLLEASKESLGQERTIRVNVPLEQEIVAK